MFILGSQGVNNETFWSYSKNKTPTFNNIQEFRALGGRGVQAKQASHDKLSKNVRLSSSASAEISWARTSLTGGLATCGFEGR